METKNHAVITMLDILSRFPLCLVYIKDHEIKKTTFSFGIFGNYSKGGQPMFKLWSFFHQVLVLAWFKIISTSSP